MVKCVCGCRVILMEQFDEYFPVKGPLILNIIDHFVDFFCKEMRHIPVVFVDKSFSGAG